MNPTISLSFLYIKRNGGSSQGLPLFRFSASPGKGGRTGVCLRK